MAERDLVRQVGAAVVSVAALGTVVTPVWAQPQPAPGGRIALHAEVATAPLKAGALRGTGALLPTSQPSGPTQQPWTATRVLPATAAHGMAHAGTASPVGVFQSSPADYTPVSGAVRGRVGDTIAVRLGVTNLGPGAPDTGSFAVVPPPGTTVTSIPWVGDDDDRRYSCRPPQDGDNPFFLCDLSYLGAPLPGSSSTIVFHIRIDKQIPGAKGNIAVYSPSDPVPGNDLEAIPVEAAPAPLWRWQNPLWRWQHWAVAAGVLALATSARRWLVRRHRGRRRVR
ncbi:hypothetical protein ACF1A5_05650 [Streptomyces sp. NPDC014864]|uniref:hypothetical protein n=1 Tax=Streptomyces sp. NPDC014864 TaxID=3364924 RepID=UPI0036FDB942